MNLRITYLFNCQLDVHKIYNNQKKHYIQLYNKLSECILCIPHTYIYHVVTMLIILVTINRTNQLSFELFK